MKKVIDGKVYNTDTAEEIASDDGYWGSFRQYDETLYRTRKGAFFLAGSGGAQSRWAEQLSDGWTGGGSGIEPLTAREALEWCEWHGIDADIIADVFADLIEVA